MTATTTPRILARQRRLAANLVPPGYVGWVLITTPRKRRKVRFVRDGLVWRDDSSWEPNRPRTVAEHALACRIEPCDVITP